MDLWVGTPVDELKGHCMGYDKNKKETIAWDMIKIRKKPNRYTDEQVCLWTCRTAELWMGRS